MNNAFSPTSRFILLKGSLALTACVTIASAQAAPSPTDIAQTPLIVTSSSQAKPNIMLLMDNSGSMGRTHMPDEVETVTGVKSVGYKSPQCNALYYNPAGSYLLPKRYDGSFFPTPTFNAAPYAGFGAFFTTPDTSVVDLATQFSPYEYTSGRQTVYGPLSAPAAPAPSAGFAAPSIGPAFYYVYSGPEPLKYDAAPCNQLDTGVSAGTSGGGFWTLVDVSTRSLAEQTHFALWYSFYRTRLGLTKSAASLAFSPLDASKRVGFITVEPKLNSGDPLIAPDRYLQIDDFATVALGQKEQWYKKLFSQVPSGSSPTREGLARVGRYYGGKTDKINGGMGGPDPMQFACQQNFTILTTDGYWNAQTQSPGGGGVQLDGTTLVGQQDGNGIPGCNVTDPYCVRPMFDGNSADIRNVTDKVNNYTNIMCSLDAVYRRIEQQQRKVFNVTRNTTRTKQQTIQYKMSSSQLEAKSERTVKTVKQTTKTVDQYYIETSTPTQGRYQIMMSQDKIVRDTEQFQRQTRQQTAQTSQNTEVVTQTQVQDEQWQMSSTQYGIVTTQFRKSTTEFREGKQQVYKRQWQWIGTNNLGETSAPLQDANCPSGYTCVQYDSFPNQLVDPASCTPAPSATVTGPNADLTQSYLHTDCTLGGAASPYGPVPACSAGVTPGTPRPANSGNSFVRITCNRVDSPPDFAAGYTVATCVPTSQSGTSPYTITNCTVVQNSTAWQTASCTPAGPSSPGYPHISTECVRPPAENYSARNSAPCNELAGPQTDPTTKITTTCTKLPNPPAAPAPPLGAGCTNNPGTSPPYLKSTCSVKPLSSTVKSITSCNVVTPTGNPWIKTQCNQVPVAPMATATPVQWGTCSGGPNVGGYAYDTSCATPPGGTNEVAFVSSATCSGSTSTTLATGAPWVDVFCTKPSGANNMSGVAWDPSLGTCPSNAGTSPPYARSTCTLMVVTGPPVAADEATCPATTTSTTSPFVTTNCIKQGVAGTFTCPGTTPTGPPWIYERCGFAPISTRNVPYGSCTPNSSAGLGPNEVCKESIASSFVPTCVEDLTPAGNNPKVTCSGPTVIAGLSGPTDPASCPAVNGPQGGSNQYDVTCVTSPFGAYATPRGVSVCPTPAMDPTTFEVTTCSNPPLTNFSLANWQPCTVAGPQTDPTTLRTTECFKSDVRVDMQGSICAGTVLTQTGTGPEIKCIASGGATAQPVNLASCAGVVGTSDPTPPFDTVTACNSTEITASWNDFGPGLCAAGAGSVVGERIDCRTFQVGSDVLDATCTSPSGPDATGVITSCPHIAGSGYKYKVSTTTTLVRTPMSGGTPSGPSVSIPVTGSPTAPTDVDGVCYASAQTIPSLPTFPAKPPVPAVCGSPNSPATWPCTELIPGAGGSSNSLADVAQYYYTTDLRTGPLWPDVVKPAGAFPEGDWVRHQHMTTFVVALGVNGTLKYRPDYFTAATGDFADIRSGVQDWPVWPDPNLSFANVDEYNNPKSIDDFWHTAVNGRGRFFNANNPTTVIDGLADALASVDVQSAAGAADGVSSLTPTSANNFVYGSSYESGKWVGDLEAFTINSVTGVLNTPRVWSAKALLDQRTFQTCDNRKIYLMRGSALVDFAWNTVECDATGANPSTVVGTMNSSEKANFSPANVALLSQFTAYLPADPQLVAAQVPGAIVNFLRGQRASENFVSGSTTKLFRKRDNVLGDLVDSQPVYVQQPFADYTENNYQVFKAANATRPSMVYVGGNDGMLHAFNGAVAGALQGQEAWAVIPSAVLPKLYQLADKNYDKNHKFFVDGTPVASDVYDGTNWHTILVGGLNAGGKGYYALDITDPANPTARWEFKQDNTVCPAPAAGPIGTTSDCNLGFSFGKPVISKIGTRWVVILTSGYNNLNGVTGDGEGFIYVLDAWTGVLQSKTSTGAGDSNTPSGLAQINNYVDNVLINNATLRAYGGDLLGNIWRFDFAPPQATLVGTATKGAARQPITTRPELAELNGEPFLLVGTGKLLGETDVGYAAGQSVYGIRDKLTAVPAGTPPSIYAPPLRNSLRGMQMTQIGALPVNPTDPLPIRTIACITNCAKTDGWVVDLAEAGERVNVDMKLVLGTLVFASNVPMDIPCSIGGHSWLNQIDFRTGSAVTTAPLSGSDGIISNYLAGTLNQGFNVIQRERAPGNNNPGDFQVGTREGDGSRRGLQAYVAPPPFIGKRISWREVVQ